MSDGETKDEKRQREGELGREKTRRDGGREGDVEVTNTLIITTETVHFTAPAASNKT